MREEADIAEEKRLAAKIVAQAKVAAPRLATMSAISEHRNRWVAYKVCSKSTFGREGLPRKRISPRPDQTDLFWFSCVHCYLQVLI